MAKGKRYADKDYFEEVREDPREEARKYYRSQNDNNYNDSYYDDYYDDEPNYVKVKIICGIIAVLIIVGIAVFIVTRGNKTETVQENIVETNTIELKEMSSTYEGYNVLGKIKIEKLEVEQYILNSTEEDALKNGVVKLYGDSLNNYGNLCLAGHNFDNVFGKLNELDIGDSIYIIQKDYTETEYEVKEILTVEPDDLTALIPREDKVELTLITCETAGTKRLVIKAEEK